MIDERIFSHRGQRRLYIFVNELAGEVIFPDLLQIFLGWRCSLGWRLSHDLLLLTSE
jgi:hypothetical protein